MEFSLTVLALVFLAAGLLLVFAGLSFGMLSVFASFATMGFMMR